MCISVAFIIVDILSVTSVLETGAINPFWKFSFVFKCFTDTIILDDFKTALDRLSQYKRDLLHRANSVNMKGGRMFEQLEFGRYPEHRGTSVEDPLESDAVHCV